MPKLTAYELEIQDNIRKNQELLKSLGIFQFGASNKEKEKKAEKKNEKNNLKSKLSVSGVENLSPKSELKPERRSKRQRYSLTYDNYHEDDDYSGSDFGASTPNKSNKVIPTRRSPRLNNINNTSGMITNQRQSKRRRPKGTDAFNSSDPLDLLTESKTPQRVTRSVMQLSTEDRTRRQSLPNLPPATPLMGTIHVVSSTSSYSSRGSRGFSFRDRSWQDGAKGGSVRPKPERDEDGSIIFADAPDFRPNLTPKEMLEMGSFGGTAFKRHYSTVTQTYLPATDYTDLPFSWYSHLAIPKLLTSAVRNPAINRYKVNAGQTLEQWEASGWINECDPRGWFQWYCRFYLGRRLGNGEDGVDGEDDRQIKRWLAFCGPSGRFKRALIKKVAASRSDVDDENIAPALRQTLQHWGYMLTQKDYDEFFVE